MNHAPESTELSAPWLFELVDRVVEKLRSEPPVTREYYTEADASLVCGIPRRQLETMRHRRVGPPFVRIGSTRGRIFYSREELLAWMRTHRVDPGKK